MKTNLHKVYLSFMKENTKTHYLSDLIEDVCETIKKYVLKNYKEYIEVEYMGPFGLGCEWVIKFIKPGNEKDRISFHTDFTKNEKGERNGFCMMYPTGEKTNEFKPGTIGYVNGFNNIREKLPMDIDEIMKIVKEKNK